MQAVGPVLLALLINAGQLKATPLLSWVPVDLTLLLGVAVAASAGLLLLTSTTRLDSSAPLFVLLLGFAVASVDPHDSEYASTKVLTLFTITAILMLAPFVLLRDRQQVEYFFSATLAIASFAAVLTITNPASVADYSSRVTFDGTNTIGAARVLGAGIVVCVVRAVWSETTVRMRLVYSALTLVLLWGLLSTGSRGPFIATALAVLAVCTVALVTRRSNGWMIAALAAVTLGGAAIADRASADGTSRIFGFFEGARDTSTRARNELWRGTAEAIPERPLGVGIGGFPDTQVLWGTYPYPHNIVLEIFAEAGWATGIFFCVVLMVAIRRSIAEAKVNGGFLTLGLLVFALVNAMVSGDINTNRLLWAALAVALMQRQATAGGTAGTQSATSVKGDRRSLSGRHGN